MMISASYDKALGFTTIFILAVACVPMLVLAIGCTCWLLQRMRRDNDEHALPVVTHRPHWYVRRLPPLLYRPYMPQALEPA